MTTLRFVTLSLCAALLLPAGCKDTAGTNAETPAPAGGGDAAAPTDNPGEPASGTPKPAGPADMVACTPDTRKGGMCTREFQPVCGKKADEARETFPNKCVACSDESVVGYFLGSCEGDEPSAGAQPPQ